MNPGKSKDRLKDSPELRRVLHDLMTTQHFGVLCTQSQGQPYGSLMCFATSDDLARVWFATDRHTRKFEHMHADSRVAFLVEDTGNRPSDTFEAVVVTGTGKVDLGHESSHY